ncbi:hypothetical protein GCM10027572_20050 [Flexivirga lutea]
MVQRQQIGDTDAHPGRQLPVHGRGDLQQPAQLLADLPAELRWIADRAHPCIVSVAA